MRGHRPNWSVKEHGPQRKLEPHQKMPNTNTKQQKPKQVLRTKVPILIKMRNQYMITRQSGSKGSVISLTHSHGRAVCSRGSAQCWKWKAFLCCPLTCSSLKCLHLQSFWVWQHYRHCVKGRASGFAVSVNVKSASHPSAPLASFSAQPRCLHLNSNFCLSPARCDEIPVLVSQRHPASRER